MMMQGHEGPQHHREDPPPPPNGSKSVSLWLRASALILALSSAIVMAASGECNPSSGHATFTYTRFGGFVLLVAFNITATILELVAVCLRVRLDQAAAAATDNDKTMAMDVEEKQEGIGSAGVVLLVLDHLMIAMLITAMGVTFTVAADYSDQICVCSQFARKVTQSKIMSLAACFAITLAGIARSVPLPFNVPPVFWLNQS